MKQETLEEAAENSFLANKLENSTAVEKAHYIAGFRECAKWQQERSYSEEEVRFIAFQFHYEMSRYMKVPSWYMPNATIDKERIFEKFKKK